MFFFEFDHYSLLSSAIIVLGIQIPFFIIAFVFKTDKITDLSYGLTFIVLAGIVLVFQPDVSLQLKLCYLLIIIWGVRIVLYLFIRILKMGEDPRFDERRNNFMSLASFWMLQAVAIWVIMLPFTMTFTTSASVGKWGFFENLGIVMWIIGFLLESIADYQKFRFKNDPKNKDRWIESGLWAYSQHPNYFGEALLWWGLFVIVMPMLKGWEWITIISPIFITVLLLKISGIPLLQAMADQKHGKKPEYQEYKRRTNLFFPGVRKK